MLLKRLVIAVFLFFCTENALAKDDSVKSPWTFEAGLSAGRPTPIMLNASVGYKNIRSISD